jgi:hypothetical protein
MVRTGRPRSLLGNLICIALVLPLSARSAMEYKANVARSNGPLVARIVSNKSIYRLGESIKLKVTLTNESDEELWANGGPGYGLASLKIFDSQGKPVPRTGKRFMVSSAAMDWYWSFDPGKSVTIVEWADIRHWRYNITQPGSYALVVTPDMDRFASADDDVPGRESNKVHITVIDSYLIERTPLSPTGGCTVATQPASVANLVEPSWPVYMVGLAPVSVDVLVTVDAHAKPIKAQVIKSGGPRFDELARNATFASTYSGAQKACTPIPGSVVLHFFFQPDQQRY